MVPKFLDKEHLPTELVEGLFLNKFQCPIYLFFRAMGFNSCISFNKMISFLEDIDNLKISVTNPIIKNESKTIGGVYLITDHINMKTYIGSSINCRERRYQHFWCLTNKKYNTQFQTSFSSHGIENFTFCLLEEMKSEEQIRKREQHYIDTLSPQLNSKPFVESNTGYKHTQESIQKMRDKKRGKSYHSQYQIDLLKKRWEDPEWRIKHTESIRNYYKNKKNG